MAEPELRRGWAWGRPRHGHPEGADGEHVAAMLAAIPPDDPLRAELRLLTLLHRTPDRELLVRFVELDAATKGKDPEGSSKRARPNAGAGD